MNLHGLLCVQEFEVLSVDGDYTPPPYSTPEQRLLSALRMVT